MASMQMMGMNAGHYDVSLGHEPALTDIPHLSHVNTASYHAMIVEDDDWLHDFAAIHSSPTASAAVAAGSYSSPTASAVVAPGSYSSPTASADVAAGSDSSPTAFAAMAAADNGSAGQESLPQCHNAHSADASGESCGHASGSQGADASVAGTDEHQVINRLVPCNCADAAHCKATVLCGLRCSALISWPD